MSLHKFAEQVAKHGRGDDSLLVHMTPDEVKRLQAFAEANGTTLTINPNTGLPEAGLLSDLFKAVAPIALGAFLGPAGFGLSSAMAGVATGGITALATGSLSRGLMAGLGAYGGAGLGASLSGMGESALGANLGTSLTDTQAQSLGFQNAGTAAQTNALATAPVDKLTAGFNAATASPSAAMDFAKANYKPLLAAAAPIMAGAMVPTTTQIPEAKSTGHIRQMAFNINPDTGKPDPLYGVREMAPVKASEWGDKTFQGQREAFYNQNQNPYQIGVASLNQPPQPTRMATGGIVALANGGPPTMLTDEQLYQKTGSWEAAAAARDAQNNAMNQYTWQQQANARDNINTLLNQSNAQQQAERLNKTATDYVALAANPNETAQQFITGAQQAGVGLTQPLATALQNSGLSAAAQYALTHADIGPAENTAETYGGLKGLSNNILYDLATYNADPRNKGKSAGEKRADALAAMNQWGLNEADIKRATGMSLNEIFPTATTVTPTGVYGTYGNNTGNPLTSTPGDIGMNPDGTVTVTPNIPGRPQGGFPGMGAVKDAYTAGGGSLGYTAKAPRTIAEFDQMYNKQTGDSLAAYNYLMGKGANNNAYPVKSGASQIAVPYNEYVLGKKTTKPTTTTTAKTTVAGTPGQPQTYFDEAAYLAANPDVAAELKSGKAKFANAYEHYLMYGQKEGRPFTGDYQGYTTALALASAAGAGGGGEGPSGPAANNSGTISGFTPAPPDASIPESSMGIGPAADGSTGSTTGTEGGAVASAKGGLMHYAMGGLGSLGSYSDGGRLLKGPGDGVSDSIPATIGNKQQPARLADGEFVVPARIVSELGNGSTEAGAKKLYAMMDRVQKARSKTTGKNKVAANSRADKYLPA